MTSKLLGAMTDAQKEWRGYGQLVDELGLDGMRRFYKARNAAITALPSAIVRTEFIIASPRQKPVRRQLTLSRMKASQFRILHKDIDATHHSICLLTSTKFIE